MATRVPVFTDNFNRADGAVGADYETLVPGADSAYIDVNRVTGDPLSVSNFFPEICVTHDLDANQYVKATFVDQTGHGYMDLYFRGDSSDHTATFFVSFNTWTTYWYLVDNNGEQIIDSDNSAAETTVTTFGPIAMPRLPIEGDVMSVEAEGTTIRVYFNDTLLWSGTYPLTVPTGGSDTKRGGFLVHKNGHLDNFEIGNLVSSMTIAPRCDVVLGNSGGYAKIISGATITVYKIVDGEQSADLAALFTDLTGDTPASNPVTSDAQGNYQYFTNEVDVVEVIEFAGLTTITRFVHIGGTPV